MQDTNTFTGANRFICERLNASDIEKRPGLKALLKARLCSTGKDNAAKHSLIDQPQGVLFMSNSQHITQTKQTIENLYRQPIENMSEKDLLKALLYEIRELREVAQFGMTKAEFEGKAGSYSQFDC